MISNAQLRSFINGKCPGMCIKTTQLGRVPYEPDGNGGFRGFVPDWVVTWAEKRGLQVEAALYLEGSYVFRIVDPRVLDSLIATEEAQ